MSELDRKSLVVNVAGVKIGGGNPIVVQSMTSGSRTNPDDVSAIAVDESREAVALAMAGSELIRIAIDSEKAAAAIPYIRENLDKSGFEKVPLVGCGQYEIKRVLETQAEAISSLGKIRINPGNIGFGSKRDANFDKVIELICKHDLPVRIGVNWGSLDQSVLRQIMDDNAKKEKPSSYHEVLRCALIQSVLASAKRAEQVGLSPDKIILSCKVSNFQDLVAVYSSLAEQCCYPLHLGLTEAGIGTSGIIKTTAALSVLLNRGIGDTIRASLTQKPGESRVIEVETCKLILQSIGLRVFAPQVTSCPGCGRTNGNYFQQLSNDLNDFISDNLFDWQKLYPGVENLKLAVMGCIVNGPGESKHADIGISLPGYNENMVAAVFVDGKLSAKLTGTNILEESKRIILEYIRDKYTPKS
ncbi:flavodoxin-dependent (E)-4-hydroxy-3-methylbut-2-enyl-diphosphate synthase [Neorickettsia sp. 179522]|uniref:flavodoxin-dependent (E)-4-hydroxy-3-methylbut-2-enyl-diphosphate synthase n=1 Tax=Neorickettsia sp. 179522 TaxID=1714371 RepID=UPI000798D2AE|nr:flavodoxin-dependent (E)-4-hydroxy-3-methylbut-2-enyl-diphosphate synthase [Neorickettsia sp. 179522]KYH12760.1 4-hydroxy-3-methylbut-2-en-1-yl diphosphate synthase [Neorickettsia sp. 179522]